MIELAHLSRAYGAMTVVDDLTRTCRPGTALVVGVPYGSLPNPDRVVARCSTPMPSTTGGPDTRCLAWTAPPPPGVTAQAMWILRRSWSGSSGG